MVLGDRKQKTEYILDSHGNKTKTPAGNVRNRKIWLVDWDKNSGDLPYHQIAFHHFDKRHERKEFNQQESSLKKADELLNKVVDRTAKKLYPELDFDFLFLLH